ncbi:VOC family protein [Cryobacterium sp. TMS1-20-1]|uniref:VOC family protein n=1 Tax=Cryobacterium sp. TMS1-20-1 TaxID=1259223 RepID=UPI00141BAE2A|nr:VOC family protein [Cryobacterium sp. TMS1-20-1]
MKIHHVGYAVRDIASAGEKFRTLGFEIGTTITDDIRKVAIAFARNGNYVVELIAPVDSNSPVDGILSKMGPTPYHLCFEVDDMNASLATFRKQGYVVASPPSPAPAINDSVVAFLYHSEIGLVELVEVVNSSDGAI